ncbi:MAG: ferrous iron transport protein A [Halobacteriovoraceae bacterium]|nr:ferrous iron transport protein A [Halobacteriovoraceae bacterium]|tara:strand:+ start:9748 stop:9996 length:249 start_codon:yes stop_codon:yes gene_type:complete
MFSNQLKKGDEHIIEGILSQDEDVVSRYYKLGIYPGMPIKLIRKAPLFGDPILFSVGGSQVALTKAEAQLIKVVNKDGGPCH